MIVAAHQPAYLPWLGYLDKLAKADMFVVMDDLQYEAQNFQNRNRLKLNHGPAWITVPLERGAQTDRVIDKRNEEEPKSADSIVSPDTAAEKPDQGEIVAVGKGKKDDQGKLIPIDVKVGDRILFGKYSGQTVKVKGDELLVMREEDIMGVIEGS